MCKLAGGVQAEAQGLTDSDVWLNGIAEELRSYGVEPECSQPVLSMLSFDEEDRPTAAEVLQSASLSGR